jgi:hypothetical protein
MTLVNMRHNGVRSLLRHRRRRRAAKLERAAADREPDRPAVAAMMKEIVIVTLTTESEDRRRRCLIAFNPFATRRRAGSADSNPAWRRLEHQRRTMKKPLIALSVFAMGALGVVSASANDMSFDKDRAGFVRPCSLLGINPAYHPEIFGNHAVAASYGFIRSRHGTWQVRPDCRR